MKPPALDLDALARAVAPLVVAQLASALGAAQAPYSTRKGGEVPAEYQGRRKAWLATAPTIAGAVRLGRWWSVPREAYAAWLATHTTPRPVAAPTSRQPWHPSHEARNLRLVSTGKG